MTALGQPTGQITQLWQPDRHRYRDDPGYRAAVNWFVHHRVVGGSVSDARVVADEHGQRVLITTSKFYPDGNARPGWQPVTVPIPLETGTDLP